MVNSADIRQAFLSFFESKNHSVVASSSLVPGDDPTLLFTNAGMVQFKDMFTGQDVRPYTRATSSQRCVRAGGKHNDLENVGYTARHHTFFEMLGNFSFGDYFKREAITYAWEFLTGELGLPPERLWITVHISDDEAAAIWIDDIGIDPERLSRLDEDNFWQMGDTGPCGPCSEIFYDHGPDVPGGPPGSADDDLDRYIEIWNLVFMQYQRNADGTLEPLPKPSIDTGMGLERIAAVMQGVHNNYDIDLFANLIRGAAKVVGCDDLSNNSLRVIADHIRSCAFLIADGVLPSNEGRGYVLRRIIRRALRHGHKLGADGLFFYRLVAPLAGEMGEAYPELLEKQTQIEKALCAEEEQFARTLDKGLGVLETALAGLSGEEIPGEVVFQLYDTYGFPVDLTNDIARERNYTLDMDGYQRCMAEQKSRARAAGQFRSEQTATLNIDSRTEFSGYDELRDEVKVIALYIGGESVPSMSADEQAEAVIVLDQTPFYAESGGQVGDVGLLTIAGTQTRFEVRDCQKQGEAHLHIGVLHEGRLQVGDTVQAQVDVDSRQATALNHSATHLLHAALRQVLGEHVNQKGSLVDAERLRFDFSHTEGMSAAQLQAVEQLVNTEIRHNTPVQSEVSTMDAAKAKGAMALFGEKYGDEVRVLTMGEDFSVELCGGTHAQRTGDIGVFKIFSESGIASGVRRIEALTGAHALNYFEAQQERLLAVAGALKANPADSAQKASQLVEQNRQLQRELDALKVKLAGASGGDMLSEAREVNGVKVLVKQLDGVDGKSLRDIADQMKSRLGSGVVLLATADEGKVALIAVVTKDLMGQLKAGDLMKYVAALVGGKGGGRPDMAQGGGTDVAALPTALDAVYGWIEQQLDV
ncbi:MAG: alanine--tRNA ligase [Porticoccaceae bacterium]|nr:alanine--tRNA ligase [Porticoccaceae bacterium]